MSNKELHGNNFGSLKQICYLLRSVLTVDSHHLDDIRKYCTNSSIDLAYSFQGIIDLLCFLSWVSIIEGRIKLTKIGVDASKLSDHELQERLIRDLFSDLYKTNQLIPFLGKTRFNYDVTLATVSLNANSVPLSYSGVRNLLLSLGFFNEVSPYILSVNNAFIDYFEEEIIPLLSFPTLQMNESNVKRKKQLSLSQLKKLLILQEKLGDQAENFVFDYEKSILRDHPLVNKIKIISKLDTSAGYDIVSFTDLSSQVNDKFIEVKSYSDRQGFFWSRNEVEVAEIKQDQYFLYLVDRNLMNSGSYKPTIIRNPYQSIFINPEWQKSIEEWFIKISNNTT